MSENLYLYRLVSIKGSTKTNKFESKDINQVLKYHTWHVKRYKEGLLMEIIPQTKSYDWKSKKVVYNFE